MLQRFPSVLRLPKCILGGAQKTLRNLCEFAKQHAFETCEATCVAFCIFSNMTPGTSVEHIVVNIGAPNKTHLGSFKITKIQNTLRSLLNGERIWSKRVAQLNWQESCKSRLWCAKLARSGCPIILPKWFCFRLSTISTFAILQFPKSISRKT